MINNNLFGVLDNIEKELEKELEKEKERKERKKEHDKNYYKNNADKIKERSIKWAKDNPERYKERLRNWYKNNKEKHKKYGQTWRKNNPEWAWSITTLNIHRNKGQSVLITKDELIEKINQTNKKCQFCNCDLDFSYGNKGGKIQPNSPTLDRKNNESEINKNNTLILCYQCNSMKRELTIDEYYNHCKNFINKYDKKEI